MTNDNQRPRSKRLRRLTRVWADRNTYFLTFCTRDRQPMLANAGVDALIRSFIVDTLERYGVWVDCYLAMPDHVHLIVTIAGFAPGQGTRPTTLGEWAKAFKAVVANREFRWQSGFFDHVLRTDESMSEKWAYIRMNPVRAGLVEKPEEWAYAGFFDPRTGDEIT